PAAGRIAPLLAEHGITPHDGGMRISTLDELRKNAAAAGITHTITTPRGRHQASSNHAKRPTPQPATRPKLKTDAPIAGKNLRNSKTLRDNIPPGGRTGDIGGFPTG